MPQAQAGKCNAQFHIGNGGRLYCSKLPAHAGKHGATIEWDEKRNITELPG